MDTCMSSMHESQKDNVQTLVNPWTTALKVQSVMCFLALIHLRFRNDCPEASHRLQ